MGAMQHSQPRIALWSPVLELVKLIGGTRFALGAAALAYVFWAIGSGRNVDDTGPLILICLGVIAMVMGFARQTGPR